MSAFEEVLRTVAVSYGPIILACLIGAICWLARRCR